VLLTEIDHVAIAVNDLEAAIAYYGSTFGAEVEHREVVESDGVEEALLKVAESYIQLLTPTRDDSPVAKYLDRKGEGLHHIGYPAGTEPIRSSPPSSGPPWRPR
jgi:methylmalonyl-CoA epimerase